MHNESLIQRARIYLGNQETFGSNDGPNIRRWKAALGSGVAKAPGIPWCSIFVSNVLMERNGLDRKGLVAALGFRPGSTFLESCDTWIAEVAALAHANGDSREALLKRGLPFFVDTPRANDLVLLMKPVIAGFSKTDAHHIAIARGITDNQGIIPTIEGNTVPEGGGAVSREGTSVCERGRNFLPLGRLRFIRLPDSLTGYTEASA